MRIANKGFIVPELIAPPVKHTLSAYGVWLFTDKNPTLKKIKKRVAPSVHGDRHWDSSYLLMDYFSEHRPRKNTRVLDVGCGNGLLLNLMASLGRIRQGHGFDVAGPAVAVANQVANDHELSSVVAFEHRSIEQGIPQLGHEVVTVVDVLHHVPDQHKAAFVAALCEVVPAGGRLIVKDMVVRPRWRAAAKACAPIRR